MTTLATDDTGRAAPALAALAVGLAALAAPPLADRAAAAMVPNYARYCATLHPGSKVTLEPASGARRCTVEGGLLSGTRHFRVDLGTACRMTTGEPRFRVHGGGYVLCAEREEPRPAHGGAAVPQPAPRPTPQPTPEPAPSPEPKLASAAPDLAGYCARRLRRSRPWYQASQTRWLCVRKKGRRVQAVVADLARACALAGGAGPVTFAGGDRRHPRCVVRVAGGRGSVDG